MFEKAFKTTEVTILVDAIPALEYGATDWWQHEEGLIPFQNEVVKYAYYRLKY